MEGRDHLLVMTAVPPALSTDSHEYAPAIDHFSFMPKTSSNVATATSSGTLVGDSPVKAL
jgi:hypothetical protein